MHFALERKKIGILIEFWKPASAENTFPRDISEDEENCVAKWTGAVEITPAGQARKILCIIYCLVRKKGIRKKLKHDYGISLSYVI